jgi:hypothetical protein
VANFGRTLGDFSVSADGAAQYRLPLWVSPGRGLVTPQLSLAYSSSGGNGLVGVGWSLTGLTSVSRCPKTVAQDGAPDGVNWNSSDALCLGGDRLMKVGAVVNGQQEYRTEHDGFAKIVAFGVTDGELDSFKVWNKDRTILTLGATADSLMQAFRLRQNPSTGEIERESTEPETVAWQVNKIEDRNGNAATVEYTEVTGGAASLWHVESRPSKIKYPPNREVEFVYEDGNRPDVIDSFTRGVHTREPRRLWKVIARGASEGATLEKLREYRLQYVNDSITGRSLLWKVFETDQDGTGNRPLVLDWSKGSFEFDAIDTEVLDAGHDKAPNGQWVDNRILVGDINNDGRDDAIYPSTEDSFHPEVGKRKQKWYIRLSTGGGFGDRVDAGFIPPDFTDAAVRPIDFNLDGRLDAMVEFDDGSPPVDNGSPSTGDDTDGSGWKLYQSNGTKWVQYNDSDGQPIGFFGDTDDEQDPVYFGDLNADGTPDLIHAKWEHDTDDPLLGGPIDGPWKYRLNSGVDSSTTRRFACNNPPSDCERSTNLLQPVGHTEQKLTDVDGDGRVELLGFNANGNPVGWSLDEDGTFSRSFPLSSLGTSAADINGDGLPDAVHALSRKVFDPDGPLDVPGSLTARLNTGNGFGPDSVSPSNYYDPYVCCEYAPLNPNYDRGVRMADFNGDGKTDVLVFRNELANAPDPAKNNVQLYVWRSGGPVDDNGFSVGRFERESRLTVGAGAYARSPEGGHGWTDQQLLDVNGDGMLDIVWVRLL